MSQRENSLLNQADARFDLLSKKLQRAYQEKNMMLAEIQSLKNQLRLPGSPAFPGGHELITKETKAVGLNGNTQEAWNHLIEANIRSGVIGCMWCMKTHVIKRIASAFHRWKQNIQTLPLSQSSELIHAKGTIQKMRQKSITENLTQDLSVLQSHKPDFLLSKTFNQHLYIVDPGTTAVIPFQQPLQETSITEHPTAPSSSTHPLVVVTDDSRNPYSSWGIDEIEEKRRSLLDYANRIILGSRLYESLPSSSTSSTRLHSMSAAAAAPAPPVGYSAAFSLASSAPPYDRAVQMQPKDAVAGAHTDNTRDWILQKQQEWDEEDRYRQRHMSEHSDSLPLHVSVDHSPSKRTQSIQNPGQQHSRNPPPSYDSYPPSYDSHPHSSTPSADIPGRRLEEVDRRNGRSLFHFSPERNTQSPQTRVGTRGPHSATDPSKHSMSASRYQSDNIHASSEIEDSSSRRRVSERMWQSSPSKRPRASGGGWLEDRDGHSRGPLSAPALLSSERPRLEYRYPRYAQATAAWAAGVHDTDIGLRGRSPVRSPIRVKHAVQSTGYEDRGRSSSSGGRGKEQERNRGRGRSSSLEKSSSSSRVQGGRAVGSTALVVPSERQFDRYSGDRRAMTALTNTADSNRANKMVVVTKESEGKVRHRYGAFDKENKSDRQHALPGYLQPTLASYTKLTSKSQTKINTFGARDPHSTRSPPRRGQQQGDGRGRGQGQGPLNQNSLVAYQHQPPFDRKCGGTDRDAQLISDGQGRQAYQPAGHRHSPNHGHNHDHNNSDVSAHYPVALTSAYPSSRDHSISHATYQLGDGGEDGNDIHGGDVSYHSSRSGSRVGTARGVERGSPPEYRNQIAEESEECSQSDTEGVLAKSTGLGAAPYGKARMPYRGSDYGDFSGVEIESVSDITYQYELEQQNERERERGRRQHGGVVGLNTYGHAQAHHHHRQQDQHQHQPSLHRNQGNVFEGSDARYVHRPAFIDVGESVC